MRLNIPTATIKITNILGKIPSVDELNMGEFALNIADAKLYTLYTSGATYPIGVREVGFNSSGSSLGQLSLTTIGNTPNYSGATILNNFLTLQPASADFGGVVTTETQIFSGSKIFNNSVGIGTLTPTSKLHITNYQTTDVNYQNIHLDYYIGTGIVINKINNINNYGGFTWGIKLAAINATESNIGVESKVSSLAGYAKAFYGEAGGAYGVTEVFGGKLSHDMGAYQVGSFIKGELNITGTNPGSYIAGVNIVNNVQVTQVSATTYGFKMDSPTIGPNIYGLYITGEDKNYLSGKLAIGELTDMSNSKFTVSSIVQGSVPTPRMSTVQRDAIVLPTSGLQIFNLTTNEPNYYNGTLWLSSATGIPAGSNTQIQLNNNGAFGASSGFTYDANPTATDNNQIISGLRINPTFNTSGYTGIKQYAVRLDGNIYANVPNVAGQNAIEMYNSGGSILMFLASDGHSVSFLGGGASIRNIDGAYNSLGYASSIEWSIYTNNPFYINCYASQPSGRRFALTAGGTKITGLGLQNNGNIHPSAVLELDGNGYGTLGLPRMTSGQRDNLNKSVTGITITNGGSGYNGTGYVAFNANSAWSSVAAFNYTQVGGVITSIAFDPITQGGSWGEVFPTAMTVVNDGGSGATFSVQMGPPKPITGATIFNTTTNNLNYYDGTVWRELGVTNSGITSSWNLTGNTGTDPLVNFIGTNDGTDFVIKTQGFNRAIFKANGGIVFQDATTIAQYAFATDQGIARGTHSHAFQFGYASGEISLAFGNTTAHSIYETTFGNFGTNYNVANGDGDYIWRDADRLFNISNGTSNTARSDAFTVLKNGNIGIGFSNPTERLEINGKVKIVDGTQNAGYVFTSDASGVGSWTAPSAVGTTSWSLSGNSGTTASNFLGTTDNQPFVIKQNNLQVFTLLPNNNISIFGGIIGNSAIGSIAVGSGSEANGANSFSFGSQNKSNGTNSFVAGYNNIANGVSSVAMGEGNTTTNEHSVAMGVGNTAGQFSVAMGISNTASYAAVAMNANNLAYGAYSSAFGLQNRTNGKSQFVSGNQNIVNGVSNSVFGQMNDTSTGGDQDFIILTDKIFEIGNGDIGGTRRNAVTVLRNGKIGFGTVSPTDLLHIVGKLRIVDGTQAAGYVFTSDANGVGSWAAPTGVNTTLNYSWTGIHSFIQNTDDAVVTMQNTRPYGTGGLYPQAAQKWLASDGSVAGYVQGDIKRLVMYGMVQSSQFGIVNGDGMIDGGQGANGIGINGEYIVFMNKIYAGGGHPVGKWFANSGGGLVIETQNVVQNILEEASSLFTVRTTTKGTIPAPKMTQMQRDAILSATTGLQIYNTTTNQPNYYDGTNWLSFVSSGGTSQWITNGTNIYYNTGSVGIGTTTPTAKLSIVDNNGTPGTNIFTVDNTNPAGASQFALRNDGAGEIVIQSAGSNYSSIASLHNAGNIFTSGNLTSLGFLTNGDMGSGGTTPIYWTAGGYSNLPTMTITAGNPGKVGIGTINPTERLEVNGNIKTSSSLKFGTDGISILYDNNSIGNNIIIGWSYGVLTGTSQRSAYIGFNNTGVKTDSTYVFGAGNSVTQSISYSQLIIGNNTSLTGLAHGNKLFGCSITTDISFNGMFLSDNGYAVPPRANNTGLNFSATVIGTSANNQDINLPALVLGQYLSDEVYPTQSRNIPIHVTGGLGTNVEGYNMILCAGVSTGNANAKNIIFATTDVSSSGSSKQNLVERMRLSGSGNLLVGTSTDTGQKLQINGKVKINDGTQAAGYIFTSDVNGVGTWVAPTVGASSGSTLAAGSNTQIQYNNNGALGASSSFAWNDTTKTLLLDKGTINFNDAAITKNILQIYNGTGTNTRHGFGYSVGNGADGLVFYTYGGNKISFIDGQDATSINSANNNSYFTGGALFTNAVNINGGINAKSIHVEGGGGVQLNHSSQNQVLLYVGNNSTQNIGMSFVDSNGLALFSGYDNALLFSMNKDGTTTTKANAEMKIFPDGRTVIGSNFLGNISAILDINSTTKGFLQPRMTTLQRDAIVTPATGLEVYNTTTNEPNYYNGTNWLSFVSTVSAQYIKSVDVIDTIIGAANNQFINLVTWSPKLSLYVGIAGNLSTANSGKTFTSTDGINWVLHTNANYQLNQGIDLTWSDELEKFIAGGYKYLGGSTYYPAIATSSDGITWVTALAGTNKGITSVTYSPELNMIVGMANDNSNNTFVYYSTDGGATITENAAGYGYPNQVIWVKDLAKFVCVKNTGLVATSTNGINWVDVTITTNFIRSIAYSKKDKYFLGYYSSGTFLKSTDGTTWSTAFTDTNYDVQDLVYNKYLNRYIMIDGNKSVLLSTDGTTISKIYQSTPYSFIGGIHAFSYAQQKFILGKQVGNYPNTVFSTFAVRCEIY